MQQLLSNRRQLFTALAILLGFIASLIIVKNSGSVSEMPKAISDPFKFAEWVNAAEDWLHRASIDRSDGILYYAVG